MLGKRNINLPQVRCRSTMRAHFCWRQTLSSWLLNVEMVLFFLLGGGVVVVMDATCHGHVLQVLLRTIRQSCDFPNIAIHCSWLQIKPEFLIDRYQAERRQKKPTASFCSSSFLLAFEIKTSPSRRPHACFCSECVRVIDYALHGDDKWLNAAAFMESPVLFKVLKTWGFIPQSSCSSTFFSTLQRREAGDLLGFDYGENKSRKAFEKNYRPGRKKLIKLQKKKINLWLCQCLRLNTRVTLTHTVILTQLHPCHTHSQAYPYFVKPFLHSMPYP